MASINAMGVAAAGISWHLRVPAAAHHAHMAHAAAGHAAIAQRKRRTATAIAPSVNRGLT